MWKLCSWHLQSRSKGRTLRRRRARAASSTRDRNRRQMQAHVARAKSLRRHFRSALSLACQYPLKGQF
jgi:hypothetical protein